MYTKKSIKNNTFYRFDFIIVVSAEKETRMSDKIPSKELLINNMQQQKDTLDIPDLVKLLDMVMQTEYSIDYLLNQLKNKRRKKKRKGLSNN